MDIDRGSGRSASPWMTGVDLPELSPLEGDTDVDVCVVGAGMAGLSVAYALTLEGRSVLVLEDAATIAGGESARTTAHLSNAFDDGYDAVEKLHGEEGARIVAESHTAAVDAIERIVRDEAIACAFTRLDGYLFVPPGDPLEALEREIAACHRAGLHGVAWADRAPLEDFETGPCLCFPDQAQFHPVRYLAGLARAVTQRGGRIRRSHAESIEGGHGGVSARIVTDNGTVVTARDVVVATNTPVQDRLTIHTKQYSYRTYAFAARVPTGFVAPALYWDTLQPYHYVRLMREVDDELLVVGGGDHKTGQEPGEGDPHQALVAWARERFPQMREVIYRWSGQVMEPMDKVAFIGRNPGEENVWIVTGDSGNGMTHGAIAGLLLRELIAGRPHAWAKLYDPGRKPLRAVGEFVSENVNMAAQYARWVTSGDVADEAEIAPGSGAIVRVGAKKLAVYRDRTGELHRFSATCPHLGAIVGWNPKEGTWDCPAHGSRFEACGRVVNGPANSDLAPVAERGTRSA